MTGRLAALSPEEKRELLRQRLRKQALSPRRAPLSPSQARLWFLHQLAPETPLYNLPMGFRIAGPFDLRAAQRTLDEIVRRHETLRTTFAVEDGGPVQVIASALTVPLRVVDLEARPAAEREVEAERLASADARRPFDLARGPLLRVGVARLHAEAHVVFATMHHLVSDGWSLRVFRDEMTALYLAFTSGQASPLPEPPVQYADFVAWQREQLRGEPLRDALTFWRNALAGPLPVLELATDRPRPAVKRHRGALVRFTLSPRLSEDLRALGRREGVTPFMILIAAFAVLLSRYTGQHDILIGSPTAGRPRAELEGVIGCFVNPVILRADLTGEPTFLDLLARVRDVALEAYDHDAVPFEQLVQELRPDRDLGHTPLFQVMFVLHHLQAPTPAVSGLDVHNGTAKFDLSLEIVDGAEGFGGWFEYDTDLFDAPTIARTAGHFETLLEALLRAPGRPVSRAALLTAAERGQLRAWNQTRVELPGAASIVELIEARAARTPDAVAVVFEDAQLTYGALNARANGLARRLRALGVGPDVPVGVRLERSLELVIAVLAVFKASGTYLPLEPAHPSDRARLVLETCGAPVVLTEPPPGAWPATDATRVLTVEPTADDVSNPPGLAAPEHLAYVIYTSGSTGAPKGAMIPVSALRNRLLWMQAAYPLTAEDRVLHKTPIGFDVSVWELLWPLTAGATLVVARPDGHRRPAYLADLIAEQAVTVTHFVPAMLRAFLDEPDVATASGSLRHVFSSGEALPPDLAERFFARIGAALHNLYGPTEAAIDVTAWTCRRDDAVVPIGRPIANVRIHILDAHDEPVAVGHPGELLIGGAGLARGYLGRPDLTAERFRPDPFGDPGARAYGTGDRARYRPDGGIEFLGRVDRQVKIRGCRVEPGEIETALAGHPRLRAAVVDARPDGLGEARLVAYVIARDEPPPAPADLRAFLKQRLPEYMVPATFVLVRALPLTPSGKVDHRALPDPGHAASDRAAAPPRTETERLLVGIWRDVLGIDTIGVDDNFFDLGGASIQCLQIVAQASDAGLALTPEMLFEHQTVAELAEALGGP